MTLFSVVWLAAALVISSLAGAQTTTTASNAWEPLKFFVGRWEGTGKGKPGTSKIEREYQFILNNKYLNVQSRSVYDPQPNNPKGEIHEEWGMISFDKSRKQFLFRQFHVEGFVIRYVTTSISTDGKAIVFTSEGIENIPAGWRARETYKSSSRINSLKPSNWQGQEKILRSIQRATSLERNKARNLDSDEGVYEK